MPERKTLRRAEKDKAAGKAPSTQAGEFVREEIDHIRRGKHGARSTKQAIAIGLSKARRAGVKLPPPGRAQSKATRRRAERDIEAGKQPHKPSPKRARATKSALKRESRRPGTHKALSRQARSAARARSQRARSTAAKKAARTRRSRRK
jgi:Family of unknown function (DUF6496)